RARRALQHFVGKEPALARKVARHLELAADVGADFGDRIAIGIHLPQRRQPHVEQFGDQPLVDRLLAREVIEEVGLAHPRRLGDLVDRGAAKAVVGKDLERRIEDAILLFLLDAGPWPLDIVHLPPLLTLAPNALTGAPPMPGPAMLFALRAAAGVLTF